MAGDKRTFAEKTCPVCGKKFLTTLIDVKACPYKTKGKLCCSYGCTREAEVVHG